MSTYLRRTWRNMIERCNNPEHVSYRFYGAKGIEVCDRWMFSFDAFKRDVGPCPSPQHSLDRYPYKAGDYEPGNVRWATSSQQANNTARNVIIEHDGEKLTLAQCSRKVGISAQTIRRRMKLGCPPSVAVSYQRVYRRGTVLSELRIPTCKEA